MSRVRINTKRKSTTRYYRMLLIKEVDRYLDLRSELKVEKFTHPLLELAFYAGSRYLQLCEIVVEQLNQARNLIMSPDCLFALHSDDIVAQLNKYCYLEVNANSVEYVENFVKTFFVSLQADSKAPIDKIEAMHRNLLEKIHVEKVCVDQSLRLINTYKAGYRHVRSNTN